MPERAPNFNDLEKSGPIAPPREVADWEYRTAYIPTFQIRITPHLLEKLSDWARHEGTQPSALVIEILEEAVRRRGKR